MATAWYNDWFDSPFYEILYKDRDEEEAEDFMGRLIKFMQLHKTEKVLDVACGSGRYSRYLHSQGFDVEGIDLSQRAIAKASYMEAPRLHFAEWDMRQPYKPGQFDVVFNLFTSFGYFEEYEDNQRALTAMAQNLKPGGFLVLDYLNTEKVVKSLVPSEIKGVEGMTFYIHRKYLDGLILKNISFEYQGNNFNYEERVHAISLPKFRTMFANAGLEVLHLCGDYKLNDFDSEQSPRMVFVLKKKE